ncbi:MAG: single-stranded-DNA-specific exonuclease RecJ [Candidatus Uhrbacteria bacterium]|nr:single-stranded-DNA-specific exonuclease RecJ [Candidatus Uhrbacteria bacterium]
MKKQWKLKDKKSDDILEQLLLNRGIETQEQKQAFLNPDWGDVYDPLLFKQMQNAVNRVFLALESGQKIVIHGDYDADGVSGTALLWSVLNDVSPGAKLEVFLPDRERDGYGVAMHNIDKFHQDGINLIITVDCGIANATELNHAHDLGIDSIICDHHQMATDLPEHSIIIHPLAPGEDYPNKKLCGTGVAFKHASAMINEARKRGANLPDGYEKWYLDLVAIATVTDVMPVIGENRILEKFGLVVLNKTRRPGLRKIIESARVEFGEIDTQAIGFRIGPRLNAAGRIGSAETAFRALIARDAEEGAKSALELEMLNRDRQKLTEVAYKEAREIVLGFESSRSINVVWNEAWAPGIVGLVAGKLVSEFGSPAFALTKIGSQFVGSGRSIGGFHLVEAMRSCGDIFLKAGGHPEACGLSLLSIEHVHTFKTEVGKFADAFFGESESGPVIEIDAELSLDKVDWNLFNDIEKLKPFGKGNPKPNFVARGLKVVSAKAVGKTGGHLKLNVSPPDGHTWGLIGFGFGDWAKELSIGDLVDLVYEIDVNEWNGNRELQGKIVDLKLSDNG